VRWHVSRMEKVGLVKVVKEGRKKRHYLDKLGQALLTGSLNTISEAFLMFLVETLEDGGLNPEIREATDERVTIRIDCPERGKDCFITINLREWDFRAIEEEEETVADSDSKIEEVRAEEA
ncbi:MAG: hypothetical protein JSW05_02835, partial [Candidatus Thorarchaeota archaeon]